MVACECRSLRTKRSAACLQQDYKIIAFVAAAVPIFLFVRSIFFQRPTRINEGFKEFKKQSDLAVSIFLLLIGCVVIFAVGKLIWAWL